MSNLESTELSASEAQISSLRMHI